MQLHAVFSNVERWASTCPFPEGGARCKHVPLSLTQSTVQALATSPSVEQDASTWLDRSKQESHGCEWGGHTVVIAEDLPRGREHGTVGGNPNACCDGFPHSQLRVFLLFLFQLRLLILLILSRIENAVSYRQARACM